MKSHLEDNDGKGKSTKEKFREVFSSWELFLRHPVRNAGFGLSCLYLTVLGFDSITTGYCLHLCVPASLLGGLMGASAFVGILGSISFPYLRWKGENNKISIMSICFAKPLGGESLCPKREL